MFTSNIAIINFDHFINFAYLEIFCNLPITQISKQKEFGLMNIGS